MPERLILRAALLFLLLVDLWILVDLLPLDSYLNPVTNRRESVALPLSAQKHLGEQVAAEFEAELGGRLAGNSSQRVGQVGDRLFQGLLQLESQYTDAHLTPFLFQFGALASDQINAFALPGGRTYVTRGLLTHLSTNDQLAAVLGHEMGHVVLRHTARAVVFDLKIRAVLYAIGSILGSDMADILGGAGYFLGLHYSREHELEADHFGFLLLCSAGYSPEAMIQVLEYLRSLEQGGQLEFLRTHPLTERRIERVRSLYCQR